MSLSARLRHRAWPLGVSAVFVVVGMAVSFLFLPLRHGLWIWYTPPDLWATFRAAQFTEWGGLGAIYSAGSHLVTLPGLPILLAPVGFIADHFHLTESFPLPTRHPTAWLVLGPVSLACVAPLLTAADAVAEALVCSTAVRRQVCQAVAGAAFPCLALFGHPEDILALAFGLYSLLAARDGRTTASAWWMGASLAVQPVTILIVPLMAGTLGLRRSAAWMARVAILPGLLVAIVLSADWHDALTQLLHQPNFPHAPANHATPWLALAPRINNVSVAAGPGRLIAIALASGLVYLGIRHRGRLDVLLIGAALAFVTRVAFEAVVVPYYAAPALVCALLLAARSGVRRLLGVSLIVLAATVVSFFHYGPWSYWSLLVGGLALGVIGAAVPPGASRLIRVGHLRPVRTTPEHPAVLDRLGTGQVA
ncbi:MAG: hypothetical protein ACYCZV_08035 [Acidimicrobiales bacterium]